MNKGLISIGSNKDREQHLALCQDILEAEFDYIVFSKTSLTPPYGSAYKDEFMNQLVFIYTMQDRDDIISLLKSIELQMGRTVADKKNGLVVIDIDLVIWNDEVLKPEDMKRDYIAKLLPDLLQKVEDKPISIIRPQSSL